jgi:hypothetical protein
MLTLHRHLTLERYELALEEDQPLAGRMRELARQCQRCRAALSQAPLAPRLAVWTPPAAPIDWQRALGRSLAPAATGTRRAGARRWRLAMVPVALLGLMLATALPAAASAAPASPLFGVRNLEEEARWSVTPDREKARIEAEMASAYIREAQTSASHNDRASYQASMDRFFTWGGRLKADVRKASPDELPGIHATVRAAASTGLPAAQTGQQSEEVRRAGSLLDDVEGESQQGEGDH